MHYFKIIFICLCIPSGIFGQQTIVDSILHDGLQRSYILYVPDTYEPGTPAPLIFNFHGYTSNNLEQMFYGDFRPIADTAGFLVVHPMGTVDLVGNPHWNVGWGLSTVDDIGFTEALMDSLSKNFSINQDRIYSTGMSNGGFFSYKLACELSYRIAAIASVTGTMNVGQSATCQPVHPMPVMEIHGTADEVVAYDGNAFFASTPSVVSFWVQENECETQAVFTSIPNTDQSDACTAEHYLYEEGNNGVTVEHFKIIGGGHTWPGFPLGGPGTNLDINASEEIWRFFSQYDIHGKINSTATNVVSEEPSINFYPNPANDHIIIENAMAEQTSYSISNLLGQEMKSGKLSGNKREVDLSGLTQGMYVLTIGKTTWKVLISHP